jgi:hypothetical protein
MNKRYQMETVAANRSLSFIAWERTPGLDQ